MTPFLRKLQFLSLPLALVAIAVNLLYTGGRWYFEREALIVPLTRELLEIWIPMLLALIAVWAFLWKRISRIQFQNHGSNKRLGMAVIAFAAIAGPLFLSQGPMEASFANNIAKVHADEIPEVNHRYVKLDTILPNLSKIGWASKVTHPTLSRGNIRLEKYCVSPHLLANRSIGSVSKVWLGKRLSGDVPTSLSDEEKNSRFAQFYQGSDNEDAIKSLYQAVAWRRVVHKDERRYYLDAVGLATESIPPEDTIILEGIDEGELKTFSLSELAVPLGALMGSLGVFSFCLGSSLVEVSNVIPAKRGKSNGRVNPSFIRFFIPTKRNLVQAVLLDSMIIVFLLMVIDGVSITHPTVPELMAWGANRRPDTIGGQWWRLLTSVFLHGGILHLAMNCYGFVIGSTYVQWVYGQRKYATIFFASGICGSLASIAWNEHTASVGASGAIFGLFGAYTAMLMQKLLPENERKSMLSAMLFYLGINVLWGMQGGIDNAAHGGGFLSGFLLGLGYILVSKIKIRKNMGLI